MLLLVQQNWEPLRTSPSKASKAANCRISPVVTLQLKEGHSYLCTLKIHMNQALDFKITIYNLRNVKLKQSSFLYCRTKVNKNILMLLTVCKGRSVRENSGIYFN